jgi:thiol:disulfide interchange protein
MKRSAAFASVIVVIAGLCVAHAADAPFAVGPGRDLLPQDLRVRAIAVASALRVRPGDRFHVALDVRIADGWAYYSPDPGSSEGFTPQPGRVDVAADGLEVGEVLWPPDKPHAYKLGGRTLVSNTYEDRAVIYVPVRVPPDASAGRKVLEFELGGQVCGGPKNLCIPLDGPNAVGASAEVEVAPGRPPQDNPRWKADERIAGGLAKAMTVEQLRASHRPAVLGADPTDLSVPAGLGLAILAGLMLNIMPCVLPVIPLRIYSVVQMARESRRRFVTLGLAFAGGIVLFFVGIAVVNVVLHVTAGRAFAWSEQWEHPEVRIGMMLLLVVVSANLFGLFTVTVPKRVAAIEAEAGSSREGHLSAVGMGLMLAVLATPCSFAILLLALGWAQTKPVALGSLTLVLIGVSMAAPHAVLAAFPALVRYLPRPGRWMELFKQSAGFVLLLVAVWLASTLGAAGVYWAWVVAYAVVLAFCLWVWGTWVRYDAPLRRKLLVRGGAAAAAVAAGIWMLQPTAPALTTEGEAFEFAPFDQEKIDEAARDGRTVLVKFTASWCLECQLIDRKVYHDPEVLSRLRELGVLAVEADVTDRGSPAGKVLRETFDKSVPLTVVYAPGGKLRAMLLGTYSKDDLFAALDDAAGA